MTTSSNHLPPNLVANLQSVLIGRKPPAAGNDEDKQDIPETSPPSSSVTDAHVDGSKEKKLIVLVTNCDGINSPGLTFLVEALVRNAHYDVHVCAPESDKSVSGHSVTLRETVVVSSTEMNGATAFEISGTFLGAHTLLVHYFHSPIEQFEFALFGTTSLYISNSSQGTPVDCVSLALSGALFSWTRPALVVSGINKGSCCGNHTLYSGATAGAREALMCGVPSLSISLNWRKDESKETDFKDAADVCLPLIHAAINDTEKGVFPKDCMLNIEVPSSPSTNKGFKITKQSVWGPSLNWQGVSANRNPAAGQYMSMHQSLGVQLAQLGRDASAAGAARRITTQKKNVEIESVAAAGNPAQHGAVKKYFRMEFIDKEHKDLDEDLDFRAVENGFVSVTPLHLHVIVDSEIQASASDWLASILTKTEETS